VGPLREAGKEAFILLCRQIDASNTADLKAGRMYATKLYAIRQSRGLLEY
jgi:plasmid replication initiation protein